MKLPRGLENVRGDLWVCAGGTVLWLLALAFLGVGGEFPLNDDWAYVGPARTLLETGRLERMPWTWMPVATHVATGAAFAWLFGFSLETLRLSTVVMGWVGLLGSYALIRQLGCGLGAAAFGALLVGFNPLYLNLSYTFMTDVPFTAFVAWSLFLLARGLDRSSWALIVAGSALALAATLSRQTGLALLIALGAVLFLQLRSARARLAASLGICAVTALAYVLASYLLFGPSDAGTTFNLTGLGERLVDPALPYFLVRNTLTQTAYLGVFLAPLAVLGLSTDRGGRVRVGASVVLGGGALLGIARLGLPMPPGMNLIYNLGLGPATLPGAEALPHTGEWIWWVGTAGGLTAAAFCVLLLAAAVWQRAPTLREHASWLLLLVFPCIYLPPHFTALPVFDRYLLPVLVPGTAALLSLPALAPPRPLGARIAAGLLLASLATYGLLGTHDYLERHRARWALLEPLIASGIETGRVDGGFEFHLQYNFDVARWERDELPGVDDPDLVLSYADSLAGYHLVDERSYRRLLSGGTGVIRLFARDPETRPRDEPSGSAP